MTDTNPTIARISEPSPAAPVAPADRTVRSERGLRTTLFIVAGFQFALGAAFLVAPATVASVFSLPTAPGWTSWLFAMMAARFLGYGVGMVVTAREPERNLAWIDTMIAIQIIDWLATVGYLAAGDVTLGQVTTASFVPVLLAGSLAWFRPRRNPR